MNKRVEVKKHGHRWATQENVARCVRCGIQVDKNEAVIEYRLQNSRQWTTLRPDCIQDVV